MSQRRDPGVPRPPRSERRPLLSVCTILILSGFLLGMAVASQLEEELRGFILMAGMAGLVAFLGLDHVAIRRRLYAERREQEFMESRLVAHITSTEATPTDHAELLAMAREATTSVNVDELLPAGSEL